MYRSTIVSSLNFPRKYADDTTHYSNVIVACRFKKQHCNIVERESTKYKIIFEMKIHHTLTFFNINNV